MTDLRSKGAAFIPPAALRLPLFRWSVLPLLAHVPLPVLVANNVPWGDKTIHDLEARIHLRQSSCCSLTSFSMAASWSKILVLIFVVVVTA